jgi:hypothetical protein
MSLVAYRTGTKGRAVKEDSDRQYREEAERLAMLPLADQREIIALHRAVTANPKLRKADRRAAAERADALERHLRRLSRRRKRS